MKLNYWRTTIIGLAFMSICAFWQLYEGIVPLILKDTFKIGDTLAGVIMALDNILALFMLPLFGAISDRTSTPIGKRMPFIIGGTALAVVAMVLMPVGDNMGSFTLFILALLVTLVAMSTYRSPAVALMPDVTPKPLRSKANAVINLMGRSVSNHTGSDFRTNSQDRESRLFSNLCDHCGLMVAAVVILALAVKENKLVAEMKATDGHQTGTEEANSGVKEKMEPDVKKSDIHSVIYLLSGLWHTML